MALASTTTAEDLDLSRRFGSTVVDNTRPLSAVSWGAIAAGAAAAAALSLILLILGVGLGLSSVSPWAQGGVGATAFGVSTIAWLTLTQLLASGMGGYLAGRLRTRWTLVHRDEVYFRDTAHGFLAWAVASLATAALLTSVIGSILGGGVQAGAALVGGVASTASAAVGGAALGGTSQANDSGPMAYFVDALFRRNTAALADPAALGDAAGVGAATPATPASATVPVSPATNGGLANSTDALERNAARDAAEVSRIFMNVSRSEPLPVEDVRYVGQIVAQRTGLSQQDAEKRVASVYARAQAKVQSAEVAARDATDKARKASAYSALWLFVSLLIGAFVASLAATFGGQRRDA
jgi:hypothetical protein